MYKSKSDLPETLREFLPEKLQELYLDAYQKAWESYEESEGGDLDQDGVAHRDAMMAVEHDYVHDRESGKWYPKDQQPEGDDEEVDETDPIEKIRKKLE